MPKGSDEFGRVCTDDPHRYQMHTRARHHKRLATLGTALLGGRGCVPGGVASGVEMRGRPRWTAAAGVPAPRYVFACVSQRCGRRRSPSYWEPCRRGPVVSPPVADAWVDGTHHHRVCALQGKTMMVVELPWLDSSGGVCNGAETGEVVSTPTRGARRDVDGGNNHFRARRQVTTRYHRIASAGVEVPQ